jgi:3'-phosphoadenosine 5'-phosphosulfate (PAPS) 3'-phosphatase
MEFAVKDDRPWRQELAMARAAVREAGAAVRACYDSPGFGVYQKVDQTPLTDADLASDRILRGWIAATFPGDAILTEEGVDDLSRLNATRCWIADPLDGTAQFVARTGEFDVLLALVVDGRPVVAVAFHPLSGQLLWAVEGQGAGIEQDGEARPARLEPLAASVRPRLATSRYHGAPATLPMLARVAERAVTSEPMSLAIGFQPRAFFPPSTGMPRYEVFVGLGQDIDGPNFCGGEWDLAATDLIVREAGGAFSDVCGRRLTYNRPGGRTAGGILASTDPHVHARVVAALAVESAALRSRRHDADQSNRFGAHKALRHLPIEDARKPQ